MSIAPNYLAELPLTAPAPIKNKSVGQLSCQTLKPMDFRDPNKMTAEDLTDVVIEGIKKFDQYLPYVIALKKKFGEAPRDINKRLKVPIKNCYTWGEFCEKHLDRTRQGVDQAIDEPELSNRELKRQVFKAEHPEFEGKTNREVDKAIRAIQNKSPKRTALSKRLAMEYSESLRPDMAEKVYYGEATEDSAMLEQRNQEQGIGVVGAGSRSHGHGLKRLRIKSKDIRVRHSIKANGSGSFSYTVALSGLLESEVIPLLKFQEQQRKNGVLQATNESRSPEPITDPKRLKPSRSKKSPAGMVSLDELPPDVQEKMLAQIKVNEQAEVRP